jgi:hypothetical protein
VKNAVPEAGQLLLVGANLINGTGARARSEMQWF